MHLHNGMASPPTPFDLIETMAFDPEHGIVLLDRHIERLSASARALAFAFDRHAVRNELQAATFRLRAHRAVRLVLAAGGAVAIEVAPLPCAPDGPVLVAIVPLTVAPDDLRLCHATSDLGCYDAAPASTGIDERVFARPDGRLTQGSVTSLFVPREGVLVTPPLDDGVRPGVLRAALLASGRAVEGTLFERDLAQEFFVGDALRGLIRARLAVATSAVAR